MPPGWGPAPDTPAVPPGGPAVPIHRDPVPGNVIVGADGLRLIDWQCPALGDPAEDLAVFLSPAMQQLYRGAPLAEDEVRAFLNAYPDHAVVARWSALRPWFGRRMAAYCLWQAARGAADYGHAAGLELAALGRR